MKKIQYILITIIACLLLICGLNKKPSKAIATRGNCIHLSDNNFKCQLKDGRYIIAIYE